MNSSTDLNQSSSSPEPIVVGYIRRAHGVRGAAIVRPLSDDPARFVAGSRFATDNAAVPQVTLGSVQPHKEGILVTLDEVTDRDSADRLRGVSLLIDPAQRRSLGADEYWPQDLIGLAVRDVAGLEVGVVVEVVAGLGQDRLRVAAEQGEFEVPFVADLVTEVDVARKRLIVDLPDGLIELAT